MARGTATRGGGLRLYAASYLAFLYLPLILLPIFSFNDSIFIAFPLSGFTTEWYGRMLGDIAMQRALFTTLKVGIVAAVASTTLGLLAARALTRYAIPGRGVILGFATLPLFIPDIVLGISLLILVSSLGIPLSLFSVVLGHVMLCLPFAIAVLVSRLEGFDRNLEDASLDLGEDSWGTFWRVTFPLVLPGIVSSLLLTFIVSFDDFLIAFFLSGGEPTLPVYIWGQLRFPFQLPGVLALGSAILLGSCIIVIFAEWVRRWGTERDARSNVAGI